MIQKISHLRLISISHKTAPVSCRERYYVADNQKQALFDLLGNTFLDISSVLLLVTCNRTELYFESQKTAARNVRDLFIEYCTGEFGKTAEDLFITIDRTEESVKHLLRVAAGLESSILGDAEILHQIKKAYHFSLQRSLQGSILERAVQTVFRSHKRVSNETAFRDGTTSTAFRALDLIREVFGEEAQAKKILFVGAGDIVCQLFKYNTKFNFKQVWITNRTASKMILLTQQYRSHIFPWKALIANDLRDFDVIISAVSNRSSLITKGVNLNRQLLLIDLAVPGNIDPRLQKHPLVKYVDLDNITSQLKENKASRKEAISAVAKIIQEEWTSFCTWHQQRPLRDLLAQRKRQTLEISCTGFMMLVERDRKQKEAAEQRLYEPGAHVVALPGGHEL